MGSGELGGEISGELRREAERLVDEEEK